MADLISNRYELLRKAADGAIAAIWQGVARAEGGFSRPVAVRVLREPWDRDRAVLGAWGAAARDLAEHASPHVEQALDFVVTDDGRAFVVTEWIEGLSLRGWLDAHTREGETIPWPLAAAVTVEVLRALASAHGGTPPICHEGIDTRAVRIARSGTVKVARFGVAPALAVRGTGRRRLEELGLRQPAPELVAGGSVLPASDLFGVGALLFELLSGRALYDAPVGETRDALVRSGEVPDLSSLRGDVPPLLIAHVERALRPSPSARFESAEAMIAALTQLLQAEVAPSGPEALAEAVAKVLDRPKPETRPRGLAELRTMHVDLAELTVLPREVAEPAPEAEPEAAEPEADERAGDDSVERRPRYRFGYKEKRARLAERDEHKLPPQPSEAQPLPLSKPKGLGRQKTEFLGNSMVDWLTLPEPPELPAKKPRGLAPQKTEFLDDSQVDRLVLPERKKKK